MGAATRSAPTSGLALRKRRQEHCEGGNWWIISLSPSPLVRICLVLLPCRSLSPPAPEFALLAYRTSGSEPSPSITYALISRSSSRGMALKSFQWQILRTGEVIARVASGANGGQGLHGSHGAEIVGFVSSRGSVFLSPPVPHGLIATTQSERYGLENPSQIRDICSQ